MANVFGFFSEAHTPRAALARFERIIIPFLTTLFGNDSYKKITISENQLCINDTPIGDWRLISNFKIENGSLKFDYGCNGKFRLVYFNYFDDYKIDTIAEFNKNGEYKIIYEL